MLQTVEFVSFVEIVEGFVINSKWYKQIYWSFRKLYIKLQHSNELLIPSPRQLWLFHYPASGVSHKGMSTLSVAMPKCLALGMGICKASLDAHQQGLCLLLCGAKRCLSWSTGNTKMAGCLLPLSRTNLLPERLLGSSRICSRSTVLHSYGQTSL